MTRDEVIAAAVTLCEQYVSGPDDGPTITETFEAAGWEATIWGVLREAGREKVWEDPEVTAYNANLIGAARDLGGYWCTLYAYPELPLEFVGGRCGNTLRLLLYPPGFDGQRLRSCAW